MEKTREFTIEIDKSIDWEIRLKGLSDYTKAYPFGGDIDYPFGVYKATKDKRIAYLYDISLSDSTIELASQDKRFLEVAKFKVLGKNSEFRGTFIDALRYIKKAFRG